MLIDAESLATGSRFECDLCVIGTGPAGMAIANALRDSGLSIIMLEGGGKELDLKSQRLYGGQVTGQPYFRLDACRWRVLGGSTNRWGGWCRPLDPEDFKVRDWLPHSGWPIGAHDLEPFYTGAARMLELPNACFELAHWQKRMGAPLPLAGTNFNNTIFQFSPETNIPLSCGQQIVDAKSITTLIHANVTEIRLDPLSQRVGSITIVTLGGKSLSVRPRAAVLAAGGIENARLLLASQADRATGLGNEFDTVGRFFMEHVQVPVGHLLTSQHLFDMRFYRKTNMGDVRLRGVVTPTDAARDAHRLLTTSIAIENSTFSFGTPFVGWHPALTFGAAKQYKRLRGRQLKSLAERLRQITERAQALPNYLSSWRRARAAQAVHPASPEQKLFSLYFRAEQAPDPENRVLLTRRRDALGVPEPQLVWNIKPADEAGILGWLKVFSDDVRDRGWGQVIFPTDDWKSDISGGPHHMGATRMSLNPRAGVVDADCRLHAVDNLYVAGSSVFATGSYVNPTFTIVSLALRLAHTLQKRLCSVPSMSSVAKD